MSAQTFSTVVAGTTTFQSFRENYNNVASEMNTGVLRLNGPAITGNVTLNGSATFSQPLELVSLFTVNDAAFQQGIILPSNGWTQRGSVLEASDAADSDAFGRSVALSSTGDILVVGAITWEGVTGTDRGGVYIYDRNGSSWTQRGSVLEASDAADSDAFGRSVALSANGDILVVGADGWEGATGTGRGGVYIYDRNGSSWTQRGSVLEASDAANGDAFGRSVALSANGDVLAVGAFLWEGATGSDRGGVYIYDRNGNGWTQRGAVLEASDAANLDYFGTSVALSANGDVLAVGAFFWEGAIGTNRGGVYIYDRNGSSWTQRGSVLEASDADNSDEFGTSVALSSTGDVLAVGAVRWDGNAVILGDRGGVYIYDRNGSSWTQRGSVLEASDAAINDFFGSSVALSSTGDVLVVGAITWEGVTGTDRGGVYIYDATYDIIKNRLENRNGILFFNGKRVRRINEYLTAVYGYVLGGTTGAAVTTADRVTFSTSTTAAHTPANLSLARSRSAGISDGATYGYILGGVSTARVVTADRVTFSTGATAAHTPANLSQARELITGVSDDIVYGYAVGGFTGAVVATADRVTFSNSITAAHTPVNLSSARYSPIGISGSGTYGYILGGYSISPTTTADRITFSTSTIATHTPANLSTARWASAGISDGFIYGYVISGTTESGGDPPVYNVVITTDRITFSTSTTAAHTPANLTTTGRSFPVGVSDGNIYGYVLGGNSGNGGSGTERMTFSTSTFASYTQANISQSRYELSGFSDFTV